MCEQFAEDWAFIAVDGAQQVFLVDDEGAQPLGQSLEDFVATLEAP